MGWRVFDGDREESTIVVYVWCIFQLSISHWKSIFSFFPFLSFSLSLFCSSPSLCFCFSFSPLFPAQRLENWPCGSVQRWSFFFGSAEFWGFSTSLNSGFSVSERWRAQEKSEVKQQSWKLRIHFKPLFPILLFLFSPLVFAVVLWREKEKSQPTVSQLFRLVSENCLVIGCWRPKILRSLHFSQQPNRGSHEFHDFGILSLTTCVLSVKPYSRGQFSLSLSHTDLKITTRDLRISAYQSEIRLDFGILTSFRFLEKISLPHEKWGGVSRFFTFLFFFYAATFIWLFSIRIKPPTHAKEITETPPTLLELLEWFGRM